MMLRRRSSITHILNSRKKAFKILLFWILTLTISIILVLILNFAFQEEIDAKVLQYQMTKSSKPTYKLVKTQEEKLILLWTPMFGQRTFESWKQGTGLSPLKQTDCPFKCNYTIDQSKFHRSHAIVYHGWPESEPEMYPLPKLPRNPNQVWIYLTREPPILFESIYETLKDSYDFNWTMTYREDSDIYFPYFQFEQIPMDENKSEMERIKKKAYSTSLHSLSVALISQCNRPSGRDQYIRELQKIISVDVYGACGNFTCHKRQDCYKVLGPKYKFWLAFENSLCLDYVTEKLFSPLLNGLVPVYLGHPGNLKNAPKNSFIHTKDFESPKQLGKYLLYLDSNPEEYLKYFLWRKSYRITENLSGHWCKLCQKLHEIGPENYKSYKNIADWFIRNNTETSVCKVQNFV